MFLNRFLSFVFLSCLPVITYSITLNLPQQESEKDIKYKDWVINNKSIPPVSKRNPDPSKGPRIPVKEIKIQGVKSYPDLTISKKELDEIVEKKRYDLMEEEFLQRSGYTIKELLELAEVLNKIDQGSSDGDYTDLPEIQKLIWLLKEQKKNRGLTIGEIEEIAETITTYYRNRGFFLAKAFVPSQDVHDGTVGLTILEGVLGKVTVAGNDLYKSDHIIGLFDDIKHKAVLYKDIEQKLYLLNDYPGLKLTGYFRPGDQIGDTHLNLNIINESDSTSFLRLDNHGSEHTGENRLYFQYQHNSPAGFGDMVSLGIMQTSSPDNSTYGSVRYKIPLFNEKNYLTASFSKNQFILDDESNILNFTGSTLVNMLSFEHVLKRTRKHSVFLKADLNHSVSTIDSETDSVFENETTVDSIITTFQFDSLSDKGKSVNNGILSLAFGDYNEVSATPIGDSFEKINYYHNYLKFSNLPFTKVPVRLITKFNIQYTQDRLPSVEQTATGGADAVRAFPVVQFSADAAAYLGMEAHFDYPKLLDFKIGSNLKFSNIASPYVFVDFAHGIQYGISSTEQDETVDLSGYGVGLEFKYKSKFTGHLMIARPNQFHITNNSQDSEATNEGDLSDNVIIIDMQYNF